MAGDWIKMRCNLWDDPRVARLCDLTDCGEAAIVGGLYWLWSAADQHSEDGLMPGLTRKSIDRKTGIQGFGDALEAIGWVEFSDDGARIIRFDEHNGASAKKRCQTAKRVAIFKLGNAEVTHQALPEQDECVSGALPREREEKSKPALKTSGVNSTSVGTLAGSVCARLRQAGIATVNPSHPKLLALLDAGLTEDEIVAAADGAAAAGKGFAWVLAKAEGIRREAAKVGNLPPARASPGCKTLTETRTATIAGLTGKTDKGQQHEAIESTAVRVAG